MSPLSVSNPASSGVTRVRGPLSVTALDKGPSTDGDGEGKKEELSASTAGLPVGSSSNGDKADCTKD